MTQERQTKKTKNFQEKRSNEPSALRWTSMGAGEFLIDLQDFFYSRFEKIRPHQVSREYARHEEEANYFLEKLKKALPDDEEQSFFFLQLDNHLSAMETESNSLFYRQGFSDGVRMILQSLMMSGL